jgi:hypothetical protein
MPTKDKQKPCQVADKKAPKAIVTEKERQELIKALVTYLREVSKREND